MEDVIRERDGVEIAAHIGVTVNRGAIIDDVRELLRKQLHSYKAKSVRWEVVRKSLAALESMEKGKTKRTVFVPRRVPPKHKLDGFPCPACGRELRTHPSGGVECQNGHHQP